MNGGQKKSHGLPISGKKQRDEDLHLFREIHKKEKDRIVSLLQPIPDEFEANGHYPLYKMASAKKGSRDEFLGESGKTDYNWLKTPPATPLFQSLEMEANAPQLAVQRELPIFQPLSRFAGNSVMTTGSSGRSASPNPKQKAPPRYVTPSEKPSVSEALNTKVTTKIKQIMPNNQKKNQSIISNNPPIGRRANVDPIVPKQVLGPQKFLAANLPKSIGPLDSKAKRTSRVVSPLLRSTTPAQIPGFTNEIPPNQRMDRSSSASQGRNRNRSSLLPANVDVLQNPKSTPKTIRRQLVSRSPSCSLSVTRGRKVETKQESIVSNNRETGTHEIINKGKTQLEVGNRTQILGSRMVDKFMNARKSSAEHRENTLKLPGSINESSGFGRIMMSKSSLDMSQKYMDVKRDPVGARNFDRVSTPCGKNANGTIKNTPSSSSTSGAA